MRMFSSVASRLSNKHSSTPVACSEKMAKLTPLSINVAPSGYGYPRKVFTEVINAPRIYPASTPHWQRQSGLGFQPIKSAKMPMPRQERPPLSAIDCAVPAPLFRYPTASARLDRFRRPARQRDKHIRYSRPPPLGARQ